MSVLVNGMKMPKGCLTCSLLDYSRGYRCMINQVLVGNIRDGKRSESCPLVSVPDHGRLIEECDAVHAFYDTYQEYGLPWKNAEVVFEKCKTILPSDYSWD